MSCYRIALAVCAAIIFLVATFLIGAPRASAAAASNRPRHVFILVLENQSFDSAFGAHSHAPYLSRDLVAKGELLRQYYAIGHDSLDNYIAMISGQAPNTYTQNDCLTYYDFKMLTPKLDKDGQALGAGCVYPAVVSTLANQLEQKHLTWRAYMEDMRSNCLHPELGHPDKNVIATRESQYATRHNPFVYFHSIIDYPTCAQHDVPLSRLDDDLKSIATTPNLVFITPNLCNDAHDGESAICPGGGMVSADRFLRVTVPKILAAPAYRKDGMLIITFDEGTDPAACCAEPTGSNTVAPGRIGLGGGRTGTLILSRFVKPGTVNDNPYNHYSLLRSIEDLFGLEHLGYAAQQGLRDFGPDVYNASAAK